MKNSLLLILLALCCEMSFAADKVYLDCRLFNEPSGKWTDYQITLDEANQTAIYASSSIISKGRSFTLPAQFTQTEVLFSWSEPTFGLQFAYRIDRTNLDFSETSTGGTGNIDRGQCEIMKPVERKF